MDHLRVTYFWKRLARALQFQDGLPRHGLRRLAFSFNFRRSDYFTAGSNRRQFYAQNFIELCFGLYWADFLWSLSLALPHFNGYEKI